MQSSEPHDMAVRRVTTHRRFSRCAITCYSATQENTLSSTVLPLGQKKYMQKKKKNLKVSYDSSLISHQTQPPEVISSDLVHAIIKSPQFCSAPLTSNRNPDLSCQTLISNHTVCWSSQFWLQISFPSPFKPSLFPLAFQFPTMCKEVFYYLKEIPQDIVLAQLVFTKTVHLLFSKIPCPSVQWFTTYSISFNFLKYGSLSNCKDQLYFKGPFLPCSTYLWIQAVPLLEWFPDNASPPETTGSAQKVCPQNRQTWHV